MPHNPAPHVLMTFLGQIRYFIKNDRDFSDPQNRLDFLNFFCEFPIPVSASQLPSHFKEITPITVLPEDIIDYEFSEFLNDKDITRTLSKEELQQIAENDFLFYALIHCMLRACEYLRIDLMVQDPFLPKSGRASNLNHAPQLGFISLTGATFAFPIPNKLLIFDKIAWKEENAGATLSTLLNDIINPATWESTHRIMRQQYYISRIALFITLVLSLTTATIFLDEQQNASNITKSMLLSSSLVFLLFTTICNFFVTPTYDGKEIKMVSGENNTWLNTEDEKTCYRPVKNLQPGFYALFQRKTGETSSVPSVVTTLNDDGLDERLLDRKF